MPSLNIDYLVKGNVVMHDHAESDLGAILDTRYLKLDSSNSPLIGTNSTTFFQIQQADGTVVFNVDTTTPQVTMPANPIIGGFTLTVPATGTAALLGTANVFTRGQTIDGSADEIQLIVQGAAGQTANLQEWQNSSGTILTKISSLGYFDLDIVDARTNTLIQAGVFTARPSGASNTITEGLRGEVRQSGNNNHNILIGFLGYVITTGSGTKTHVYGAQLLAQGGGTGRITNLHGFSGEVYTAGPVTNAYGVKVIVKNLDANSAVTNAYGLYADPNLSYGAGYQNKTTNAYGLYLPDINSAATLNYAIYTNAGDVRFGDTVEIYEVGTQLKLSGGAADYATFAVAADGAMTITTVDADAAEADIILMPDGNVGIGTISPIELLSLSKGGASDIFGISFKETNLAGYGAKILYDSGNDLLKIVGWQNSVEYLGIAVQRLGNVGIGVTDPDTKLEVFGSTGLKISFDATDNTTLVTDTNGDFTISPSGTAVILADAKNLTVGTTTGTKIGTAAGQKLGFWNVTPVVQQVFATGASHTVDELITVLQTLGLVKQA